MMKLKRAKLWKLVNKKETVKVRNVYFEDIDGEQSPSAQWLEVGKGLYMIDWPNFLDESGIKAWAEDDGDTTVMFWNDTKTENSEYSDNLSTDVPLVSCQLKVNKYMLYKTFSVPETYYFVHEGWFAPISDENVDLYLRKVGKEDMIVAQNGMITRAVFPPHRFYSNDEKLSDNMAIAARLIAQQVAEGM